MNRLLSNVKQGITKVRGKTSSESIEPIQQESKDSSQDPIDLASYIDWKKINFTIKLAVDEYEKTLSTVEEAFKKLSLTTSGIGLTPTCSNCPHEAFHHNRDKRMKSGYGKCICGNCKKYVALKYSEYKYSVPAYTPTNNWKIPITGSGSSYVTEINLSNYYTPANPTMSLSFTIPYTQSLSYQPQPFIDNTFVESNIRSITGTKKQITIYNVTEAAEYNGDINIIVQYTES